MTHKEKLELAEKLWAAFVLAETEEGIAATTRASDRGEAGKIGLPGGKLDPGERGFEAALREAKEEGWDIGKVHEDPFHVAVVEGKPVAWFRGEDPVMRKKYKEQGRISPLLATLKSIESSGYGNDEAIKAYLESKHMQ